MTTGVRDRGYRGDVSSTIAPMGEHHDGRERRSTPTGHSMATATDAAPTDPVLGSSASSVEGAVRG